jgi:ATP-dependent Clp protease ATP-binding subunit ClpA
MISFSEGSHFDTTYFIEKKSLLDNLITKGIFAPEFINRFSNIILFKPLKQEEVRKVSELMINDFANRLIEDKKIKLIRKIQKAYLFQLKDILKIKDAHKY